MTGIVITIIVFILVATIVIRNKLVELKNLTDEAFSTMDVYLKKRWDLVPNLVSTVKAYAEHETDVFEKVANARAGNYESLKSEEKIDANLNLEKGLEQIKIVAEAYPELKANENFLQLSDSLTKVEEDIANSRKYYNATVRKYNDKVEMFPSLIIAKMFGYKTRKMFEANNEDRKNVVIDL